ncbi:PHB depolymerase family esterase [Crateriforma spongiae]|uniref:PHB depolymerase family esterase n=1 Tax=Crateriforma spongiae TaxID=2724528 RepID=UPI0014467EA7|nr:PHB depolymerase family esterase [Crateriforma spongiae]
MMPTIRLLGYSLALFCVTPLLADSFSVHVPPSANGSQLQIGVTFNLWIPDDTATLRGVVVHQHGCGEGACRSGETAATDLHWQALARKWDCALLSPRYHQSQDQDCRLWCDPRQGSGKAFVAALEQLADQSRHPELARVPWCLWGHSGGGFWASLMQMEYPQRIVAIWFQSGTAHSRWVSGEIEAPSIPNAAMGIPMIANPGFKERDHQRFNVAYSGCYEMVKDYRQRGAPIAFTPDPKSGHETRDSRYLAIPFFDACLAMRLPGKPGTADLKPVDLNGGVLVPLHENYQDVTQLSPIRPQNPSTANWLPNQDLALKWAEFIRTGEVADTTPPPQPKMVSAEGNQVRWQAEADLESGIAAFVILKDGSRIGRVPEESKSQFGRPLFQGNTYHDTPAFDAPEMEFLDPSGTPGRYQVITVNSVGLESQPTATE